MNIREIAKLANVSIATVSRVVNRPEVVLPETREHVLEIMREHSYTLPPARSGKGGRTGNILLLAPDGGNMLEQRLMAGLESVAGPKGYVITLCNTHGDAAELQRLLQFGIDQRCSGVVISGGATTPVDILHFAEAQVPFVLVGNSPAAANNNTCYINTEEGAYRMARHLLEMERRRLALLCGKGLPGLEAAVRAGLDGAFREAGLSHEWPGRLLYAEDSVRSGYRAASDLLIGEMPDAVFATSDELALGLIGGLQARGLAVPADIAVTGFSDSPVSGVFSPALTTIEQPTYKLGMVAARMLFDLIDVVVPDAVPQEIVLLPKLKIRASCGNRKPISTLFE